MFSLTRLVRVIRYLERAPEVLRCSGLMQDWRRVTAAYLGLTSLRYPYEARLRDRTVYRFAEFYDLETFWQIYCRGVYECLSTDRCIVDIGANIGLFSCFAARSNPACVVYAVEPFPGTYARLVDHVRRNGLSDRVRCLDIALSGTAGTASMSSGDRPSQMVRLESSPGAGTTAVATETLSGLLTQIPGPGIDLIKMDIEGSEYEVVLSTPATTLERVNRLTLEFHQSSQGTPETLVQHLKTCGFRLTRRVGDGDYGLLYFDRAAQAGSRP